MSDQTQPTRVVRPSAPPPERGNGSLVFFDLSGKRGVFEFEPEEGAAKLNTRFVMGYLEQFWLEWDKGRDAPKAQDRIEPRWKLRVVLSSAESDGERRVQTAWITIGPRSGFFGAAHGLLQCAKGDFLGFKAVPGDNGTFVNVDAWDGEAWHARLTPKGDGRDFGLRYDEVADLLPAHPAYKPYEKRAKAEEDEGPKPTSAPSAASRPAPSGSTSEGSPATPAGRGDSTSPASRAADPAPGEPPAGKSAFGFAPGRWPLAADWDADPKPSVLEATRKKAAERLAAPQEPNGEVSITNSAKLAAKVSEAYGLERSAVLSRGRAMLLYDFLTYAPDGAVETLRRAAFPVAAPGADEYDPFAEPE